MSDWFSLLISPGASDRATRRFRVLQKRGQPFLYLPEARTAAEITLNLYPAQRPLSQAMRGGLKLLLRCRLPLPSRKVEISVRASTPFTAFLRSLIPNNGNTVPTFGVLEGYNRNPDQRYILLLFDAADRPQAVVKLGLAPEARALVQRERDFFLPTPPLLPGLPRLLDSYSAPDAEAIGYAYEDGRSPSYEEKAQLGAVLGAWVSEEPLQPMAEFPKWRDVEALRNREPRLSAVLETLAATPVRPVLSHGDFTAWNIRINLAGEWRVLDWERGRRHDLPAWDWFTFVVQYHLLVLRSSSPVVADSLEEIWTEPAFLTYADSTGIRRVLKEHTIAFLLYMHHYFPVSEGRMSRVADELLKRHF